MSGEQPNEIKKDFDEFYSQFLDQQIKRDEELNKIFSSIRKFLTTLTNLHGNLKNVPLQVTEATIKSSDKNQPGKESMESAGELQQKVSSEMVKGVALPANQPSKKSEKVEKSENRQQRQSKVGSLKLPVARGATSHRNSSHVGNRGLFLNQKSLRRQVVTPRQKHQTLVDKPHTSTQADKSSKFPNKTSVNGLTVVDKSSVTTLKCPNSTKKHNTPSVQTSFTKIHKQQKPTEPLRYVSPNQAKGIAPKFASNPQGFKSKSNLKAKGN